MAASEAWVIEEQALRPELGDATLAHLGFIHDHDEAGNRAINGELQMAFLLTPFPLDAFESIVGGGQRLPRKSTFFFPKLPTGLVINRLEGELYASRPPVYRWGLVLLLLGFGPLPETLGDGQFGLAAVCGDEGFQLLDFQPGLFVLSMTVLLQVRQA